MLAGREKQVAIHPSADAAGVARKQAERGPGPAGIGGLRRAAADVGSGSDQVGLVPAIVRRSGGGEKGDRVGIVRGGVGRAAAVRAAERLHIFRRADA